MEQTSAKRIMMRYEHISARFQLKLKLPSRYILESHSTEVLDALGRQFRLRSSRDNNSSGAIRSTSWKLNLATDMNIYYLKEMDEDFAKLDPISKMATSSCSKGSRSVKLDKCLL